MEEKGFWLGILEYAQYRGISITTARRYIKANTIKYKKEQGRYLVYVTEDNYLKKNNKPDNHEVLLENQRLKLEIKILREENADLKMLVSLYENEKKAHRVNRDIDPPTVPQDM